jgi:probable F420-dependent oxidoreductase
MTSPANREKSMAISLTEAKLPYMGLVVPTKELSLVQNDPYETPPLIEYLETLWDIPGFFYAVYHHTISHAEKKHLDTRRRGESRYDSTTPFPDPFSILTLLANNTEHVQLFTAVLVAPQMQTASLAQRIASIANLSKGRFRLGLGVGWSLHEYQAMGMGDRFTRRGQILNQQIPAIRELLLGNEFSGEIGEREIFEQMAINPPFGYEVPVWIGGQSRAARKRAAQFGTGWMPMGDVDQFQDQIGYLQEQLELTGKDPGDFQTMGRIALGKTPPADWLDNLIEWIDAGVTHIALTTTGEENDVHPPGKNNLQHHSELFMDFRKASEWILGRDTPHRRDIGSLFAEHTPWPVRVLGQETTNLNLQCFPLNRLIKLQHIKRYLSERGYASIAMEQPLEVFQKQISELTLVAFECMQRGEEKVWFLREKDMENDQIFVAY